MAMKSRKHVGAYHFSSPKYYPAISQAYWAPQPQTAPYSVPGRPSYFRSAARRIFGASD